LNESAKQAHQGHENTLISRCGMLQIPLSISRDEWPPQRRFATFSSLASAKSVLDDNNKNIAEE
jgi:hypothetical protein